MEDKTTKRIIILFAALVLCFCHQALAEGLPAAPAAEKQPANNEAPVIAPIIADGQQPEAQAQQPETETSQPGQEPGAEGSETEPPGSQDIPGHQAAHHVEERPRNTVYLDTGSMETHGAVVTYDLYCAECQRVVAQSVKESRRDEPHVWSTVRTEPTCAQEGRLHTVCTLCGKSFDEALPCLPHTWSEWEDVSDSDAPVCEKAQIRARHCLVCGLEETDTVSAPGHQWEAVSYQEATCTEDGAAVHKCAVCGKEETIVVPAYGHTYVRINGQDETNTPFVCALCGKEKEETKSAASHVYYNTTVTSFGPTTSELIGGSVWNRVTPVDLSQTGVFTYPLIASNLYTVGTATVVNEEDVQEIIYNLSSSKINVHSASLVVYPDLEALKTGENAVSFDFNSPIDLKACFGEDAHVIVAITLKADYDPDSTGVRSFSADQALIDQMMDMIQ